MHRALSKALSGRSRLSSRRWGPMLSQRTVFFDSQESQIFMGTGHLEVRNSDTLQLKLYKLKSKEKIVQPVSVQIGTNSNLQDLSQNIQNAVALKNIKFYSEENILLSDLTPVEAFLNRQFAIVSENGPIKIEGQFLHPDLSETKQAWREELRESLKQLQQPIFIQREIESYLHRVETWVDAKYGYNNPHIKMKTAEVQDILVQALKDPDCEWAQVRQLQGQWRKVYYQLQQLKRKYEQAVSLSMKKARNRMYIDLGLILCNIGFIGGGTYFIYSWDIIEPWAYFISSAASIYLFRNAAKFRKPFSLNNYKNYLVYQMYLAKAAHEVGLDLDAFKEKQRELQIIEATFKDYLITKL